MHTHPLIQRFVAVTAFSLLTASHAIAAEPRVSADRIFINGEILTMNASRPTARAIAIRGAGIAAVGSNAEVLKLKGAQTEIIDLEGRTVIPGLVDTHIHAIRGGQSFTFESYWYDKTSLDDALRSLKQEADKRGPGKWVAVTGAWHPDQFTERRAPTVADLTARLPDNPAYVQYLYDYALVNAKGIAVLGLDTGVPVPAGITVERNAEGKATGKLLGGIGAFSALFGRLSARPEVENRESLREFFSELNHLGVTGLIDPAAGDRTMFNPLFALWQNKALTVRVGYRIASFVPSNEADWFRTTTAYMPPRFGDDMLRFVGLGESLVGAMNDGVRQTPGFSPPQAARDELFKVATLAAERGYSLEIHAYTDDAANAILDVFEKVAQDRPIKHLRWTITHINTGSEATFERMNKLGIAYTVQMGPYFEAQIIKDTNGAEVAQASPPTRLALNKGMMVAGGTDSTRIGVINVWRAIEYHVTGRSVGGVVQRRPDYKLTREEALRLYTANAAWITSDEQQRGTLEPGKLADLAVLDAPYMRVPEDRIHDIRSVLTLVGGKVVYQSQPSSGLARSAPASSPKSAARREHVLKAIAKMEQVE
jgi:predicted amidohydrolase YtcJ